MFSSIFSMIGSAIGSTFWLIGSLVSQPPAPPDTAIVFVNGIWTPFDEARIDASTLKLELEREYPGHRYKYDLAYNATATTDPALGGVKGNAMDLLQVGGQKILEKMIRDKSLPAYGDQASTLGVIATQLLSNAAFPEMSQHLEMYRKYLRENRKIVIVGYSQGTLYANAEFARLTSEPGVNGQKVSVMNIAAATAGVPPRSSYVTSDKDVVIRALSTVCTTLQACSNVLAANVSVNDWIYYPVVVLGSTQDPMTALGHSFTKIYLNRMFPMAGQILRNIDAQART